LSGDENRDAEVADGGSVLDDGAKEQEPAERERAGFKRVAADVDAAEKKERTELSKPTISSLSLEERIGYLATQYPPQLVARLPIPSVERKESSYKLFIPSSTNRSSRSQVEVSFLPREAFGRLEATAEREDNGEKGTDVRDEGSGGLLVLQKDAEKGVPSAPVNGSSDPLKGTHPSPPDLNGARTLPALNTPPSAFVCTTTFQNSLFPPMGGLAGSSALTSSGSLIHSPSSYSLGAFPSSPSTSSLSSYHIPRRYFGSRFCVVFFILFFLRCYPLP
jgi:hypothetical protein